MIYEQSAVERNPFSALSSFAGTTNTALKQKLNQCRLAQESTISSKSAQSMMNVPSLCSNPTQCTAFHELSAHMSEMNTKLTSLLSLMQMFFHSWRTDSMKQQKTQEDILRKILESQNQLRAMQSVNLLPPLSKHQKKHPLVQTPMAAQIQMLNSADNCSDWTISPEALPVEKNTSMPPPPPISVNGHFRGGGILIDEKIEESLKSQTPAVSSPSVLCGAEKSMDEINVIPGIKAEHIFGDGEEKNGDSMDLTETSMAGAEENTDSPSSSSMSGSYTVTNGSHNRTRFRLQTRTFPQTVNELRRHVLLFPGHVVTPRALSRVGSLAYFRKKKMISYDVLKVNVDALRHEGMLTQDGYRLPHFKVHPTKLTLYHQDLLKKYKVTEQEYADAFSSPPYNLSEKRRPEDFSTVTMVGRDWKNHIIPKLDLELEAKKLELSAGGTLSSRFLDSLGLEMPGMPSSISPDTDEGEAAVDGNIHPSLQDQVQNVEETESAEN